MADRDYWGDWGSIFDTNDPTPMWGKIGRVIGSPLDALSRAFNGSVQGLTPIIQNWMNGQSGGQSGARTRRGGGSWEPQAPQETQMPGTYESFLRQAQNILGGPQTVSYDPLRQNARSNASDYDAKIGAMYNQLVNSIKGDAPAIQQNYQTGINDSSARATQTQGTIQNASDAAAAKNEETLKNLGLGEAAGNIVAQGRDINTDTARAVADSAQRQQVVGDQIGQRQTASVAHNTNLAGAAGLEGTEQRSRIQSELANLLAQYDVQEQAANQQAQQNYLSQQSSLAQALLGDAWNRQNYQDELSKYLYEQQAAANRPSGAQVGMNVLRQLQAAYPDLSWDDYSKILAALQTGSKLG